MQTLINGGIGAHILAGLLAVSTTAGTFGPLSYEIYNGAVEITSCDISTTGTLTVPDTIEGFPVTKIDNSTFSDCTSIESILLPESVNRLGNRAFDGCTSLTNVVLPPGLEIISHETFSGCSALEHVSLPASLIQIEWRAFRYCTSLKAITIPGTVASIGPLIFDECESLTSINVEFGNTNFSSVDGVLYNASITELKAYPGGKTNETYSLPSSVDVVEINAIRDSDYLRSILVEVGNTNFTSHGGVLFNADQTELIRCPGGMVGEYTAPNGVTNIANFAFYKCSQLTRVLLPENLTDIGIFSFEWCELLSEVVLPQSIERLGNSAFWRCYALKEITLPASLERLENNVFRDCSGLHTVSFLGNEPTYTWEESLYGTRSDLIIHYASTNTGFATPMWLGVSATPWFMDNEVEPDADLSADLNGDGVDLLTAYALNLDPDQDLSGALPKPVITTNSMSMSYYAASPGVSYTMETSDHLGSWTTNGVTMADYDENHVRTDMVDLLSTNRFLRLTVEK